MNRLNQSLKNLPGEREGEEVEILGKLCLNSSSITAFAINIVNQMRNTRVNTIISQKISLSNTKDKVLLFSSDLLSIIFPLKIFRFKYRSPRSFRKNHSSSPFSPLRSRNNPPRWNNSNIFEAKEQQTISSIYANWNLHSSEFLGRTNRRCVTRLSNYLTDTDHLWITRIEPQESLPSNRTRPTEPLMLTCSSFSTLFPYRKRPSAPRGGDHAHD